MKKRLWYCIKNAAGIAFSALIKELPNDQAQILAKVYMEGKSHTEVAGELDLPLGTVKSRVRLALQKLQIQLER